MKGRESNAYKAISSTLDNRVRPSILKGLDYCFKIAVLITRHGCLQHFPRANSFRLPSQMVRATGYAWNHNTAPRARSKSGHVETGRYFTEAEVDEAEDTEMLIFTLLMRISNAPIYSLGIPNQNSLLCNDDGERLEYRSVVPYNLLNPHCSLIPGLR